MRSWLTVVMLVSCCVMLVPVSAWANHDPDINDDGVVNILDLSLAGSCFNQDPTTNTQCTVADINHDDFIDLADINTISSSFGKTFPTLGILEPSQLTIMVGDSGTVTVRLQGTPVTQDTPIALESDDSTVVQVTSQAVILSGEASATFQVTGVTAGGPVTITATLNSTSATTEITVVNQPPPPNIGGTGVPNPDIDIFVNNTKRSSSQPS